MAFTIGAVSQFSDTNSIADPMILIAAKAIELGRYKSQFYQAMVAPLVAKQLNTPSFEIFGRSKTAKGGTVDGAWDINDVVDLGIDTTSLTGLTVGSVIKMLTGEVVIVKSVDRSAGNIDVYARGAGGTTASIQTDAGAYTVIGYAGKDSELENVESMSEATGIYTNYAQTIFETLDWEFAGSNYARQGIDPDDIIALLTNEAVGRVAESLGNMSINGIKQAGASGGTPAMSAGLLAQLTDTASSSRAVSTYAAGGAITETKLRAALKAITLTGTPDTIWVSSTNKEVINKFNSSIIQTIRTDNTAGSFVDTYDYDGLMLNVRVDSDMPDSNIPIVTQSKCQVGWVEGDTLKLVDEPKTSSRVFRQSIQGSFGFGIEDVGYAHTLITGVTV